MYIYNYILISKFEKFVKQRIYHVYMILECNLMLVGRMFLFVNTRKSTHQSVHGTRLGGVAQDIHIALILSVCRLEQTANIYFLSHDIQHILYVVLLYSDINIPFITK